MCPALCTFARGEAQLSSEDRGRIFELVVGLDLMRLQGALYYWRDGNDEVDFATNPADFLFRQFPKATDPIVQSYTKVGIEVLVSRFRLLLQSPRTADSESIAEVARKA